MRQKQTPKEPMDAFDLHRGSDKACVRGLCKLIARDPTGRITQVVDWGDNLIVDDGLAGIASRLNGDGSEAVFTTFAVGTGTTAAAAGDSALETEITDSGLARAAATVGRETDTATNDTATWDKTWTVTGTKAVTECGIINNVVSGGTLLGRRVFSAINVANGYTLQLIYKIVFS